MIQRCGCGRCRAAQAQRPALFPSAVSLFFFVVWKKKLIFIPEVSMLPKNVLGKGSPPELCKPFLYCQSCMICLCDTRAVSAPSVTPELYELCLYWATTEDRICIYCGPCPCWLHRKDNRRSHRHCARQIFKIPNFALRPLEQFSRSLQCVRCTWSRLV